MNPFENRVLRVFATVWYCRYFFGGALPPAFSRCSCSNRSCSSRVRRLGGGWFAAGGGVGAAATTAGGGALALGGIGTSMRNSDAPRLCRTGSPFTVTTTWQNRLRWIPAGAVFFVAIANA